MHIDSTFKPAWWLRNGHLQTLYPALCRRISSHAKISRERLTTPDKDFIDLDWCGKTRLPLVILLHGLSGSSQSSYIKGLQQVLIRQGFRSVALNFRGCSGESNNLARSYHSGDTDDIDFIYQTLRQREPDTPVAVIGFSLGGNVLLKWLGERGNDLSLFAAVSVSVPFVLSVCASKLDSGFSKVYRNNLLGELKAYIAFKLEYLLKTGKNEEAEKLKQLGDLSKINSFWQYDNQVIAALYGYKDAEDYYQRSSARQFLHSITVPTLMIQSKDDPFMTSDVIPDKEETSSNVCMEITDRGGHVGFITGSNPFKPKYWLDQRIPEFLNHQLIQCSEG